MSENPEDGNISKLAVITCSGLVRGSIFLSISLIDSRQGSGFSDLLALLSTRSTVQPYMGYRVGFLPLTANKVHQVAGSSGHHHRAADSQANSSRTGWGFLARLQGTDSQYYLPGQRPASTYMIQTPQLGIRHQAGWMNHILHGGNVKEDLHLQCLEELLLALSSGTFSEFSIVNINLLIERGVVEVLESCAVSS